MYDIDYHVDGTYKKYRIKSNHLPRIDDDLTINGTNYQVIHVKHSLITWNTNVKAWEVNTLDEKFIVTLQERKEKFSKDPI